MLKKTVRILRTSYTGDGGSIRFYRLSKNVVVSVWKKSNKDNLYTLVTSFGNDDCHTELTVGNRPYLFRSVCGASIYSEPWNRSVDMSSYSGCSWSKMEKDLLPRLLVFFDILPDDTKIDLVIKR